MRLHVLLDPPLDGPTNMARDEHLLHAAPLRPAVLRLYAWSPPTISLGCFQRSAELAALAPELQRLAVVRRITGGGAILHDAEVTYALVLDDSIAVARQSPVALYTIVHTCWRDALAADGALTELAPDHLPLPAPRSGPFFCFEKPGRTDLVVGDKKLLGSSQRRISGAVLQHGSLIVGKRFAAHPGADLGAPDPARVRRWTASFAELLAQRLALTLSPSTWPAESIDDIAERRARFASPAWRDRW